MHFLFTDETNTVPTATAKFFVYGGLIVPGTVVGKMHSEIAKIRSEAGYKACDEFKFNTATRPSYVTQEAATEGKRRVLTLCQECECRFIVHVILHNIISGQPQDQQAQWAADYVIGRFNFFLREINDEGICIIDNLPHGSQWKYLSDKFCRGLVLDSREVPLDRIRLFSATCIGASHLGSAVDVVLGSFRYCINEPANQQAASTMLGQVARMMWHKKVDHTLRVRGRGLILRPEISDVTVPAYRTEYENLIEHLRSLAVVNQDDDAG